MRWPKGWRVGSASSVPTCRGRAVWLADPTLYHSRHDMTALAHLPEWIGRGAARVGTSLGGICG
jgi:hypothetical protein